MCNFCETNLKLEIINGRECINLKLDNNNEENFNIIITNKDNNEISSTISIKYCPYCGEKLKKEICNICNGSGRYMGLICNFCIGTGLTK